MCAASSQYDRRMLMAVPWEARLGLEFEFDGARTVLSGKRFEGPLVVQKPLYPEGAELCHAIVVHPPAGIVGGDDLELNSRTGEKARTLLTTPGASKWYRSAGAWGRQRLKFDVAGTMEWLPRETIVFDGALARLDCEVNLGAGGRYIGWEVLCLGRTGAGERFGKGEIRIDTKIAREGKLLWLERGRIEAGGRLMGSPAGLAGKTVCGTLVATLEDAERSLVSKCRELAAVTCLPGLLIARYLGDSSEEAMEKFARLWECLRPAVAGREAVRPRIWST
jgi:urease accessory protein